MELFHLLLTYLKISFASFGGIYSIWALVKTEIATSCAVMSSAACTDLKSSFEFSLAISNLLPGPKVSSLSIIGFSQGGYLSMLVILIALILPGIIIIPIISKLKEKLQSTPYLNYFLKGARVASIAILILFFLTLMQKSNQALNKQMIFYAVALLTFIASHRFSFNPILLVIASAFLGYFLL